MWHTFQTTASHSRLGVWVPTCVPCCTTCGWTADFMLPRSVTAMQCKPGHPCTPSPPPLHSAVPCLLPPSYQLAPTTRESWGQTICNRLPYQQLFPAVGLEPLSDRDGNTCKHSERTCLSCSFCVRMCAGLSGNTPSCTELCLECSSSSSPPWPELSEQAGGDIVLVCLFWSMHLVSLMSLFMCW